MRPSAQADGTVVQAMWTAKDEGSGYERIGKATRSVVERDMRMMRELWRQARIVLRK